MTHTTVYSTRILKTIAILLLAVLSLVSCKKENDLSAPAPQSTSVEGLYKGKYGFGNDTPDIEQRYKINAGGVFQEIGINSGMVIGEGSWILTGNKLTASYTIKFSPFSKYSISATFNAASGKLVGTWGGEHDPSDGGKIDMNKQ